MLSSSLETDVANFLQITPVQRCGEVWVKRDDYFQIAGVKGGKARTCWALSQGANGLITAGSRKSPQISIVAHIASYLGVPCRVYCPYGKPTPEIEQAKECGAEVIRVKPGYNSVLIARAHQDAEDSGWREIPFGMECTEAVKQTSKQIVNVSPVASRINRIVVPVGSGMTLAGVLHGLRDMKLDIQVLGVIVGADPTKRLDRYAPMGWKWNTSFVKSRLPYLQHAPETKLGDINLDPIYEAKCLPYLKENDLFWIVGIRQQG